MAKSKASNKGETKILAVKKIDGEYQIEIPADAQLTFGPAIPQARSDKGGYSVDPRREYALRVYQGTKTNIIAVFTGVVEFRVLDLFAVKKKIASEAGQTIWKSDEEGFEISKKVKREGKWVDETLGPPRLPGMKDPF